MKSEFLLAFNQICTERNLPKEVVLEALSTALVSAYRRNINASSAQNVTAVIDGTTGVAQIYAEKEVAEDVTDVRTEVTVAAARQIMPEAKVGDMVMVESTPDGFGRIAAQTAKQVILQRIREAERDAQYNMYAEREEEIINGVVQSIGPSGITLNLGRTEALMPKKEQVPGERYQMHQRLRAYVLEVRKSTRGPQIIVSRSHKNMLRRLLELEVPEIFAGTVEIKSIAREPGARSKIAVAATQAGIDPVGACVGMRGVRIQSIVNELGGEKIDVIEWNLDPAAYIQKALSPARVLTVHPDDDPREGKIALVVVPDDQLSLAIGREGQNARLAAKLTGWRIDIQGSTESLRKALAELEADPEISATMGADATAIPSTQAALQRHTEQQLPWNQEEMQSIKHVLDGVHRVLTARKQAERERLRAQIQAERAIKAQEEAVEVSRKEQLAAYKARIPAQAYETMLADLGISARVLNHLEKSDLTNVGQIHERLVSSDESMLSIEGIGPKGLTEIKQAIEEKGLGLMPLPEPVVMETSTEAGAGQPIEPAQPIGAEAAAGAATAEAVSPIKPIEGAPAIELEEVDDDDDPDKKLKKKGKRKDRTLVLDEKSGVVVAKKQRKTGRATDIFELIDEEEI
ncbi:MAG TPA: transcription termination factor NusA [Anaerolineae bacterium]|nr:transcription termination factor NusA [Anaerolineae bacterium]